MKEEKQTIERVLRGSFFLKGALTGVAILLGFGSAKASAHRAEMATLITADGKLNKGPMSLLPKSSGLRKSNRKLLVWKEPPISNDQDVHS